MFTNLFGKQYKRNPNLIDTNYNFTECNFLHNTLCSLNYPEYVFDSMVKPILDKLSIFDNCFLQCELEFIKDRLEFILTKNYAMEYDELLEKTKSYLTNEYIQKNREKAEL